MSVVRDKRIVALRDEGCSFQHIAQELGLSVPRVTAQYKHHRPRPDDETVPPEMSVLTAREIREIVGCWPSAQTARDIYKGLDRIMNAKSCRRVMVEVGAWLESDLIKKAL